MTLVDPYALEMDQDYDCTHNSNPDCSYTLLRPGCARRDESAGHRDLRRQLRRLHFFVEPDRMPLMFQLCTQ